MVALPSYHDTPFYRENAHVIPMGADGNMVNIDGSPTILRGLDGYSGNLTAMDDNGIAQGMAFLIGQLEWMDRELYKPLSNVTWPRDIPVKTGGGAVSHTSNFFANYASSSDNEHGFIAGQSNNMPIMQANLSKDLFPVFPWRTAIRVPLMDQERLAQAGVVESLAVMHEDGLKLKYNKMLDQGGYLGYASLNTTGLLNNSAVTATSVPNGAAGTKTWSTKTPQEILNDVNNLVKLVYIASEYDPSAIINHITVPPSQYTILVDTIISSAGSISLLEFLLKNNLARQKGQNLVITDSRWNIGAGASVTDRMCGYVYDKRKIHFNITKPLARKLTAPDVLQDAYLTSYESFVGPVKVLYPTTVYYYDGI